MPTFQHKRTGRLVESDDVARYDNPRWQRVAGDSRVGLAPGFVTVPQGSESKPRQVTNYVREVPEVPDGTVADVLEWAGDDADRRNAALEAEEAGKRRKGILDALS